MANVVVVGSQWGDEGKGKIVDWLSERADVVVRFQGGHNAGHTLVVDGKAYKLSLLPSGVVRPGKLSVIGNGVVLDPHAFIAEIGETEGARRRGDAGSPENRRKRRAYPVAAPRARRIPRGRRLQFRARRSARPAAASAPPTRTRSGRRAVRVMDLADLETLPLKIDRLLTHHNALRRGLGHAEVTHDAIMGELTSVADEILPYMDPVWKLLDDRRRAGERILFEGAQGTLLDIDHGTYPFVTSSNTVAGQAATGSGVGPGAIGYVLGITKAYTTRVGEGPFPTEQKNEIGEFLGKRGHEFGTVTGRKRRCGWFDAVLVRQAVAVNGIKGIALTKLDVLDGLDEIKVCIGYRLDGEMIDYLPASQGAQARVEPVYETLEGWKGTTAGARSWNDLPAQAVKYVRYIEELIGAPVALLSTSPERDDTILVTDPFQD